MVVLCDKIPDDERRAGFITIAGQAYELSL